MCNTTEQEILTIFDTISNWGRWGADDEKGTLNYISAGHRRRAVAAVHEGLTISCGIDIDISPSVLNPTPAHVHVLMAGDMVPEEGFGQARDFVAVAPHGPVVTHLDALCHVFYNGMMYNGRPASLMRSTGAEANDVTVARDGIVARGLLLDMPALRGSAYLEPTDPVRRAELEDASEHARLTVSEGDAVLIRVGRHCRRRAEGPHAERPNGRLTMAGLHPDCLPWMAEHRISMLVSDAAHDVLPNPFPVHTPIHVGALVYMGLHLVDNASLDELAAACAARNNWSFMFVLAPLRIGGGTGSPANPIAIL